MSQENPFNVTDKFLFTEFCNKIESFNSSSYLKNNDKSKEFRQLGNQYFAKDKFDDALIYFVKVFCVIYYL